MRPTPLIIAGTGNRHKVEEIARILAGLGVEIRGADVLPEQPEVDETGTTFEENAAVKARTFARAAAALAAGSAWSPIWVISDDSGLCVDGLGGRPGVHSARYASLESAGERPAAQMSATEANNLRLLRELEGVPGPQRTARFVCAVALARVPEHPGEAVEIAAAVRGECRGLIAEAPRGDGGFGYDPLFLVPELGRTFAEIPPEEKNRMSHRARALEALRDRLPEFLREDPTGDAATGAPGRAS